MRFSNRQQLVGSFGMVTSTHWLATAAGISVLERGGNAFDAAAATGFALQVVEPHLNGLGGEVPIIGFDAERGEPFVVCGQGPAPAAASIAGMRDLGLDIIPGSGLLPACVPGAFGAWMELLARWGTRTVADVLGYATEYAGGGYPLLANAARAIETVRELFADHWPSSAEVYLRGGAVPEAGARFANPDLARTYQRLAGAAESAGSDRLKGIEAARTAFYDGFVAEAFGSFFAATEAMDSSGVPHRGLLTAQDMANYRARVEEPLRYDYRGLTVCKTGPWGQGPVFAQQLALLSGFDLDDTGPTDVDFVHTVVECAKLAFADREAYYGDPDFVTVPMDVLLSAEYNDVRRRLVTDTASAELRPGHVDGYAPTVATASDHAAGDGYVVRGTGEPTTATTGRVAGDTCHLDVVDRWGNMVSATPSGGWLQSSPVIPGLGFGPTTRGQMFWLDEDVPSALAGGKRPRTTLSPTLVLRDGAPELAFGTPGGDAQDQWTLLPFLHYVHHGLDLQDAIEAPSFHSTHFPSSFYPRPAYPGELHIEDRFGSETLGELADRGHGIVEEGPWSLGRSTGVGLSAEGFRTAAATQRGLQGYAAGR
jgi:gamma-glutamyltranspeptidase / glutathione hydrolase